MEKLVKLLFVFFLFTITLYADFKEEFASIQKQMQTQPSKAYTDLQSLYLHLILEGNDAQKVKVLQALIDTSKKLDFDYSRYEKALAELKPKVQQQPLQKQTPTQSPKVKKIVLKDNILTIDFNSPAKVFRKFALKSNKLRYVYDFKAVLPDVSKSFTYDDIGIKISQFDKNTIRVVFSSSKKIAIKNSAKNTQVYFKLPASKSKQKAVKNEPPATIRATSFDNGILKLVFNKPTAYKDFILKRDKIRYVYDLHAVLPQVSKSYSYADTAVKISQFDSKTTRVVFSTDKKLDIKAMMQGKSFIVTLNANSKSNPTIVAQANRKLRVVLDPGHGGSDPGAVGYRGFREKVVVQNFTKAVKRYLEKSGIEVILTRDDDKYIKLGDRTAFANKKKADVFVSIHANAAESKKLNGVETYFLSPARSERAKRVAAKENKEVMDKMAQWSSKNTFLTLMNREKIIESNKLAIDIQKNMLYNVTRKYKDVRDGGVREAPFWVLVGAQMPAVLVELGYISNKKDARRLVLRRYRGYQDALARGIAEGIINYLSLAKKF